MSLFKKKTKSLFSPVKGRLISLDEVNDNMFRKRMLGDGVAFILKDDKICSPCDGEIVAIAPSKHAFGIKTNDGKDVMIHMGLDSYKLNGEGFDYKVSKGDKVFAHQEIVTIDLNMMDKLGIDMVTPMVVTSMNKIKIIQKEDVDIEDEIIQFV